MTVENWTPPIRGAAGWNSPLDAKIHELVAGVNLKHSYNIRAALAARDVAAVYLVFAGSSTVAGLNSSRARRRMVNLLSSHIAAAYPLSVPSPFSSTATLSVVHGDRLSVQRGIRVANAGTSGATSATYLDATARGQIGALAPRIVLHMIGSNDYAGGMALATYRANMVSSMDQIDAAQTVPPLHILIHPYRRVDVTPALEWSAYGEQLRSIAEQYPARAIYVNLDPAYIAVGVPGVDRNKLLDPDNVHQTDAGHAYMADLLVDALGIPRATVTQPNPLAIDSFLGAAGALLNARSADLGTWGADSGFWNTSGQRGRYAGGGQGRLMIDVGAPDVVVEADISWPSEDGAHGLIARATADGNTRLTAYFNGTVLTLSRVNAGTLTSLATNPNYGIAVNATKALRLECRDNHISVFVDDTRVITYLMPAADATAFAGLTHAGLRSSILTANGVFDQFAAWPL